MNTYQSAYWLRQACIGLRMSTIELKSFLFALVTNFTFAESDNNKVGKANV